LTDDFALLFTLNYTAGMRHSAVKSISEDAFGFGANVRIALIP
jgi:hypothetical protein